MHASGEVLIRESVALPENRLTRLGSVSVTGLAHEADQRHMKRTVSSLRGELVKGLKERRNPARFQGCLYVALILRVLSVAWLCVSPAEVHALHSPHISETTKLRDFRLTMRFLNILLSSVPSKTNDQLVCGDVFLLLHICLQVGVF